MFVSRMESLLSLVQQIKQGEQQANTAKKEDDVAVDAASM